VVVLDGVLVVVVVDLDVLVVLELVLVDELVVVAAAGQLFAVNEEIMLASWLRSDWSVPLTDEGRFATEVLNACAAFAAAPHWRVAIAAEIASSWLFKLLACSPESRLPLPPHATTSKLVSPSPPARSARGA
jgi:hypothetical protein